MRKQFSRFPFFLLIASGILFSCRDNPNQSVSFNRDIRPIINNKCITCHGGIKKAGGFSLLFEEEAFGETDSGRPAIIAGNAEASELFRRIIHEDPEMRMPSESAPLTEEETDLIRRWIDEGAKWEKHWAFIPPDKTINPPPIDTTGWARNEIDHFIYNKLKEIKLSPSPEAGREILLRRMSLDLTGLPPTLEELDTFLADNSPEAYEKQADRLLASPHFGERWTAMWLDLARYSDTKGYEKDLYRNIWKYRDWVINAFNQDMPFD
ncbi:MAG: DUF1549 domain-containing protein, partial [Cyclobacteriaceae bacterium]|nr:DUF1549 domain-containing protein [Cyclobacteriaceae bacterium]